MNIKKIDLETLSEQWMAHKEAERVAVERRREIEDTMREMLDIREDSEGTSTSHFEDFTIKVACRIDRKVDGDMAQEIAAENGLQDHLSKLFRWKPEINMTAWKAADESITGPLARAITAKPGRPSFSITRK